jgi:alpha-1,3-rhamnosyl/mannosyltransferase
MRVVLNQLPALGLKTGVGHYVFHLVAALRDRVKADRIVGYPQGWMSELRHRLTRSRQLAVRSTSEAKSPARHPFLNNLRTRARDWYHSCASTFTTQHFRRFCTRGRFDLYHEPNALPLPSDLPTLATLHDLSVVLHPEWHPPERVEHYERNFHRGLARCQHFLAVSEFTRQESIRTLGIAPAQITRTYNGIRPGLRPLPTEQVAARLRALDLPPRYLLHVGTIEPRKNLLMLMRVYCSLPAELRECWPLLLVGNWGWNTAEMAVYYHDEARHRGVRQIGYLAEEHLAALYNGARALVFPSLYEGFGLPPVEMLACGGAVLASTAGAVKETVGHQACLIDPLDSNGWRDSLTRILTDDDWWRSWREGAEEAASAYTWDSCAAETLKVYRAMTMRLAA